MFLTTLYLTIHDNHDIDYHFTISISILNLTYTATIHHLTIHPRQAGSLWQRPGSPGAAAPRQRQGRGAGGGGGRGALQRRRGSARSRTPGTGFLGKRPGKMVIYPQLMVNYG